MAHCIIYHINRKFSRQRASALQAFRPSALPTFPLRSLEYTCIHVLIYMCMHLRTRSHIHVHGRAYTFSNTCAHAHTHGRAYTFSYTCACAHAHTHKFMYVYTDRDLCLGVRRSSTRINTQLRTWMGKLYEANGQFLFHLAVCFPSFIFLRFFYPSFHIPLCQPLFFLLVLTKKSS